jgi:hypothetical protein
LDIRNLQLSFNEQVQESRLDVFQTTHPDLPVGEVAEKDVWVGVKFSLYLITDEADTITPVASVTKITEFLGRDIGTSNLHAI